MVSLINSDALADLSAAARQSPRLRKNFNFHASDDAGCHRLLNALEPGTYVRPHRHLNSEKDETMIALSGRFGILIFDEEGKVIQQVLMAAGEDCLGINIPAGVFHSMVALESGSVFLKVRRAPMWLSARQKKPAGPRQREKRAVPLIWPA